MLGILFVICSCHSADAPVPAVSSDPAPDTDVRTAETVSVTEESTPVPAVRYQTVYETAELAVDGYVSKIYERNGLLYVQTTEPLGAAQRRFTLRCYDDTAALVETFVLETPADVPGEAIVYRLSDGRFLVSDGQIGISYAYDEEIGSLYLFAEDGGLLHQVSFDSHCGPVHIMEQEDGTYRFLAVARQHLYLFNESLEQQRKIDCDRFQLDWGFSLDTEIADLGHGRYLFGAAADELFLYDDGRGTTNVHKIRLPSAYQSCNAILQSQGGIYLRTGRGMEKYSETGDQPTLLFDWLECGSGRLSMIDNEILMLNDRTMVYSAKETRNGRTEPVVRMVTTRREPMPDHVQQITLRHTSDTRDAWFEYAVMAFNAQNNGYRVTVLYPPSYMEHDACKALIGEDLMYDSGVDMFLTPFYKLALDFYDKNAFVDLMPLFGEKAADCIPTAYGVNGSLYFMPLGMTIDTFTASASVIDGDLTWEDMYRLTESLSGATALMTDDGSLVNRLRNNGLMSYFDKETQTSWYDSDAFRNMIGYLDTLPSLIDNNIGYIGENSDENGVRYSVTNATLAKRLREGGLYLLGTPMNTVESVATLKLLYGDTEFVYCGFPDTDCSGAYIFGVQNVYIAQDTDVMDGCLAFLEFLLSDEMQTNDQHLARVLPSTDSALKKALGQCRYVYYDKMQVYDKLETPSTAGLSVAADGYTSEYQEDFGRYHDTSYYHVIEITDEDREKFFGFISGCRMKDTVDDTVRAIVTEELSYWQNNARTLEETTKIIDSRVWIYLNE